MSPRNRRTQRVADARPSMEATSWRAQLPPGARSRIVNRIMEELKRHLPISSPEGLICLQDLAIRFEEKMYTVTTSKYDYLWKIATKMQLMEARYQTPRLHYSTGRWRPKAFGFRVYA
ncbi:hypothetical protein Sjap_017743 [Stephania japonica]|uniref:Mediator complex subunit 15 KIX domain-containing protein n=1 Tax=Stephania japonica TaxID=461633 RepID=A0AAP0I6V3_9MAGN